MIEQKLCTNKSDMAAWTLSNKIKLKSTLKTQEGEKEEDLEGIGRGSSRTG